MKMAKPSEQDIEAAGQLISILERIDGHFNGPYPTQYGPQSLEEALSGGDDSECDFDQDKTDHLRGLYNSLAGLLRQSPGFHLRVIAGMCYVIMFDQNKIIDPDSSTLDLHPRFVELEKQRDVLLAACEGVIAWDKRRGFPIPYKVRDPIHAAIASVKGGATSCAHPKAKTQYTGDGTPVSYCPDCGLNEAVPVRFQCDDTEGGAA